jgi:hypothetical protein
VRLLELFKMHLAVCINICSYQLTLYLINQVISVRQLKR